MSMKGASAPWTRACADGSVPQCAVANALLKAVTKRRCAPKTKDATAEENQRLPRSSDAVSTTSVSRLRPRSAARGTTTARHVCLAPHHCQPRSPASPPPPRRGRKERLSTKRAGPGHVVADWQQKAQAHSTLTFSGNRRRATCREQRVPERQQRTSAWDCQRGGAVGCSPPAIACPRQSAAQRASRLPGHPSRETTGRRARHSCGKATSGAFGGVRLIIRRLITIKSESNTS